MRSICWFKRYYYIRRSQRHLLAAIENSWFGFPIDTLLIYTLRYEFSNDLNAQSGFWQKKCHKKAGLLEVFAIYSERKEGIKRFAINKPNNWWNHNDRFDTIFKIKIKKAEWKKSASSCVRSHCIKSGAYTFYLHNTEEIT